MPLFMVSCYEGGVSDGNDHRTIEAKDELEAAESVCGGPLIEGVAKHGQLRAQVRPLDKPSDKKFFRDRPQQISN